MSRMQENPIRFRASSAMYEGIVAFAEQNQIYNASGDPNISGAVRILVGIALDRGDGQGAAMAAYESARSQLLDQLRAKVAEAFSDLAEDLK